MDNPPLTQEQIEEFEMFEEKHREELYIMAVTLS